MSYLDPDNGESFIFRIRKTLIGVPSMHWFNTYEARFTAAGTKDDLDSLAAGLVLYEAEIHYSTVLIDQVTISTWSEDSHPYNPESFVTQPQETPGSRAIGVKQMMDLRVCLFVKRNVDSGRIGRLFYRGALTEDDTQSFAGEFQLSDLAGMSTILDNAVDAGGLGSNLIDGAAQPRLALIGASQVTRFLAGFQVGGVAVVKLNHKYFDRA